MHIIHKNHHTYEQLSLFSEFQLFFGWGNNGGGGSDDNGGGGSDDNGGGSDDSPGNDDDNF